VIALILLLQNAVSAHSIENASCTDKLRKQQWPIDCFLLLDQTAQRSKEQAHQKLDRWCQIYKDELLSQKPPEALFSLNMPSNCHDTALKALKHFEAIEILKGDFLNSFP
jgi:hypothetical protein